MKYMAGSYLLAHLLDSITTHLGLLAGASEANMVPAMVLTTYGEGMMVLVKWAVVLVVLVVVIARGEKSKVRHTLTISSIIVGLVVVNNLFYM